MIPQPLEVNHRLDAMPLTAEARIVITDPALEALGQLFAREVTVLTGLHLSVTGDSARDGDIVLTVDSALAAAGYLLDIATAACVTGGSEQALAHGTVTLLHALHARKHQPELPCMHVGDRPGTAYRGLMVDLARQWHPIETLKRLVAMCRWYKLNFLHLHLTDDQSFTFPSTAYPDVLIPDRHYTREQLLELENYARTCGVMLLPELDVPGHSRALLAALPEVVGCENIKDHIPAYHADLCPGRESTYMVMETLIDEIAGIFQSTPYIHIGGDETERRTWASCGHCRDRKTAEGLADEESLYRYFLMRVNDMVRKAGRKTIVWEGFGPGGDPVPPPNITVMVFESDYHTAPDLLDAGYPVINTSWQPLYVCGPSLCWPPATIYNWNYLRWESPWKRSAAYEAPIQVQPDPDVLGGQLCSWGQADAAELPSLRERVAALSERLWNPDHKDLPGFLSRLAEADHKLSRFFYSPFPEAQWPPWLSQPVETTPTP